MAQENTFRSTDDGIIYPGGAQAQTFRDTNTGLFVTILEGVNPEPPANQAPTGASTFSITMFENTSVDFTRAQLLQGYSDPDGDELFVSNLAASNGSITYLGSNQYRYTSNADYTGSDTITYTVSDGLLNAATPGAFNVTVEVFQGDPPDFDPVNYNSVIPGNFYLSEDYSISIQKTMLLEGIIGDNLAIQSITYSNGATATEEAFTWRLVGDADNSIQFFTITYFNTVSGETLAANRSLENVFYSYIVKESAVNHNSSITYGNDYAFPSNAAIFFNNWTHTGGLPIWITDVTLAAGTDSSKAVLSLDSGFNETATYLVNFDYNNVLITDVFTVEFKVTDGVQTSDVDFFTISFQ